MKYDVILISVSGTDEFDDLLERSGVLHLDNDDKSPELNWFHCDGDGVELSRKRVVEKDNKITVHTSLGNKFVFQKYRKQKA